MTQSNVYCTAPWKGVAVLENGDVTTCCLGSTKIGNLNQDYSFYQDQNFNITDSVNIFYSNSVDLDFTGFLPEVEDSKMITIKNLSNRPLYISGANISNIFDRSDEYLTLSAPHGITLLGVNNNTYTGWVNINSTQGIA